MTVTKAILDRLAQLEEDHDVKVLYACESGSRAWGFESADSDFDVRFIYIHSRDWYLSIDADSKRDVIELPIEGNLDINGWDIVKALRLFQKSNPPLLEWLGSPTVYLEQTDLSAQLRQLRSTYCSTKSCVHHYLHMARGNFRGYLHGTEVNRKKYLYVLRPVLAVKWIEAGFGPVPTEFNVLVERMASQSLQEAIHLLLEEKRRGFERDRGPAIPELSDFIEAELARLEGLEVGTEGKAPTVQPLNELFRNTLAQAWI